MDYTAAATAVSGALTSAGPIMTAIIAVVAGIFAFRKVAGLLGR